MSEEQVDLLIVGGGINGAGIARDAAGRGLSVMLVEKDDLSAHTSSASSKLVHGGLRYLEQYDFKLVRESLQERERLLRAAPHIVRPLQFVVPMAHSPRAAWKVRAGLLLYDRLGRRKIIPSSRSVRLDRGLFGEGLRPGDPRAFAYWDCRVQDSRLVILNAMDAAERGATIRTRTELVRARCEGDFWSARIRAPGHEQTVRARSLVNAAGPWAAHLFERIAGAQRERPIRLVKGSHIVLPRLYPGKHAFLLQNKDGRVVFAIPFEGAFTLVGTTDVDCTGPAGEPAISGAETEYLLATVRDTFVARVSPADIVWSYSGIRTLVDDGTADPSKAGRDYALDLDVNGPPLLSVFGGKLTTYRRLAEQAMDRLARHFPKATRAWTDGAVLPGGDIPMLEPERFERALVSANSGLAEDLLIRLARTYGSRTEHLLAGAVSIGELGEHFGAGLYAREVDYLVANEWARTAEDILFRRTKLGLHVPPDTADRLNAYLSG